MKFPPWLRVHGDQTYRGDCPKEEAEQITFINWLRREYPDTLGALVVHVKNEGKRTVQQAALDRAGGMTKGAADILVPGAPCLVLELKRRDHTQSSWQSGQQDYLKAAHEAGAFVAVCLGAEGAKSAVQEYLFTLKC